MKDAVRKNVKGCLGECKKPFAATQDGVLTMIKGYKKSEKGGLLSEKMAIFAVERWALQIIGATTK